MTPPNFSGFPGPRSAAMLVASFLEGLVETWRWLSSLKD